VPRFAPEDTAVSVDVEFEETLDAARAGDPVAREALLLPLLPAVRGYLRGRRVDDVDDACSDVVVRVLGALPKFHGDARLFRSWVFAIAHNRAVDGHRRRRDHAALDDVTAEVEAIARGRGVEEQVVARATHAELLAVLDRLTKSHRDVLMLRIVGDLSVEETASVLGRTHGAVKVLQHRALRAVRKLIEEV
jgi:RNA polymerase sigma-70 factor (ECF subfamily)